MNLITQHKQTNVSSLPNSKNNINLKKLNPRLTQLRLYNVALTFLGHTGRLSARGPWGGRAPAPRAAEEVASSTGPAAGQFGHHLAEPALGILHGGPAATPGEEAPGARSRGTKRIFAKAAQQLSGEFGLSGLVLPAPKGHRPPESPEALCPSAPKGGQFSPHGGHTDWRKGPELIKCLLGPTSVGSWEMHVATLRKAK